MRLTVTAVVLSLAFLVSSCGGPKSGKKETSEPGPVAVVKEAENQQPEQKAEPEPAETEDTTPKVVKVVTAPVGEISLFKGKEWASSVIEKHPVTGQSACIAKTQFKLAGKRVSIELYAQYSSDKTIKRYMEPVVLLHTQGVSEFVSGQFLIDKNRYQLRRAHFFPFQQKGVKAGLGEFSQSKSLIEAMMENPQGTVKLQYGTKNALVATFNTAELADAFEAMENKCSVEFLNFN